MERLKELSIKKVNSVSLDFKRFLFDKITLDRRLTGISGARGCGKTTLMLQILKQNNISSDTGLYISLDDIYFSANNLVEFAENYSRTGGKYLFIDEVHKYRNWSQEIKNIYDNLPELNIAFTSSSAIEIHKGSHDLSRRAVVFFLPGLSYREFILFHHNVHLPRLNIEDILSYGEKISTEINALIKPYKHFEEYLKFGYYPFYNEYPEDYHSKLLATINLTVEYDLPSAESIDYLSVSKIKKLIYLLSTMVPYTPNISKLAEQIHTTRPTLLKYLDILHKTQIIMLLKKENAGISLLNKPEKIYLNNTNLYYALNLAESNIGAIRETFFMNQCSQTEQIYYSEKGDFFVNNKYIFEIGGKSKTRKQIQGFDNAYVVKDNLEYAGGFNIPMFLFGLLY